MARATFTNILEKSMPFFRVLMASKELTIVFMLIAIMAIIIVPLPSGVLDLFLTVSLSLSALIIMISVFIEKPTDFTTYPTMILLITLFRLSLNIATTRMILANGNQGPEAVSDIIAAFGNFVVGGNYVIGIIVFTILVLINFMVVTNGSTRVAEVAARFTLDAMPGKQMAIDADLNAGLIDDTEAKRRREEIVGEANFYGAMDGSSKFVKGDAIAGIIITLVNIIGGILIGVFYHDMSIKDSAETFTILTIGDGLVGQIPALLVSTATGIIITRASKSGENFAQGSINQLLKDYKVLLIVGVILLLFASVPGLPAASLAFVGLFFLTAGLLVRNSQDGSISLFVSKMLGKTDAIRKKRPAQGQGAQRPPAPPKKQKTQEELREEEQRKLDNILKIDVLEIKLGYGLIKLADTMQGGVLLDRIRSMRQNIAKEYGFVVPQVHISDDLTLDPNTYNIMLKGSKIGEYEIKPGSFLIMNNGLVIEELDGEKTIEPTFKLEALWIPASKKEEAIINGYTVVDASSIIVSHLSELIKKYAEEILTRQDVDKLIKSLEKSYPRLVEDVLKMDGITIGLIQRVLKSLLHEKIPIKDMLTIVETIADVGEFTNSLSVMMEHVRSRLARTITALYKKDNTLQMVTIDIQTEQKILRRLSEQNGIRQFNFSVNEVQAIIEQTRLLQQDLRERGVYPMILITEAIIRKPLAEIYEKFDMQVVVLATNELDASVNFEALGQLKIDALS